MEAEVLRFCGRKADWTFIYPVEVGSRDFVGTSPVCAVRVMGVTGANWWKAFKELSEAEKSGFWLWLRRKGDTSG